MERKEFRVKERYRILAARVAACIVLIGVVVRVLGVKSDPGMIIVWVLGLFYALVVWWTACWSRLRVDGRGISVRSWTGWSPWPWEDFEYGRIERGPALHEYHRVPRKKGEASLKLSFFFGEEATTLCEREIGKHLHPPAIEIPDELTLRYRKSLLTDLEAGMDASGIHLKRRKKKEFFPWDAVREVGVETMSPEHRDFLHLRITLPNREISLEGTQDQKPQYKGPEPKVVRAFLERHVNSDNVKVSSIHGIPETREALEAAKKRLAEKRQTITGATWVGGGLCLFLAVWMWFLWEKDSSGHSVSDAAFLFSIPAIFWFGWLMIRRWDRRECESRERELEEAEKRLGPGTGGKEEKTWAGI